MLDALLFLRNSADGDLAASEQAEPFEDFELGGQVHGLVLNVIVPQALGTSPTLDIKIQSSSDGSNAVGEEFTLPQITAAGVYYITIKSRYRYFRHYSTVGGTSPDFGEVLIYPALAGQDNKR